jgi:hypothetical protein
MGLTGVAGGVWIFYVWRDRDDGAAAVQSTIGLVALLAALAAAMYAYAQYREWAAEHHRSARITMWLEAAPRSDTGSSLLPNVSHEDELPSEPMFTMRDGSLMVGVAISVEDRFPLLNCTLNIVVPSDYDIQPVGGSGAHRVAEGVSRNGRVNPDVTQGYHVRYTVWTGELSPRQHFRTAVKVTRLDQNRVEPFRLMAELSCTPAPASERDQFRFALIAPE